MNAEAPAAPEVEKVTAPTVHCDGGDLAGHPLVYLRIGDSGYVECPYCDKRFELRVGDTRDGAE